MKKAKYLVWIGGTANGFDTKLEAECELRYWQKKGYKEVINEKNC